MSVRIFILLCLLILIPLLPASGQIDTIWIEKYNSTFNGNDEGYFISVDDNGFIYVAGKSRGDSTGDDFITLKYNEFGDTVWIRRYSPGYFLRDMDIDNSGNVYLTGWGAGNSNGGDYNTVKYYLNGDTAWARRYNAPGDGVDYAEALVIDNSGCVYVTGQGKSIYTREDISTVKYSPDGDLLWARQYGGNGGGLYDGGNDIAVDENGNVYVTGSTLENGSKFITTIKYTPNGDTAWVARFTSDSIITTYNYGSSVTVDDESNVYVAGTALFIGNGPDCVTLKYYPDGTLAWAKNLTVGSSYVDYGMFVSNDDSGNVYMTGIVSPFDTGIDIITAKYSPVGDTLWTRQYAGYSNFTDTPLSMCIDNLYNVYVVGLIGSDNFGNNAIIIKYNSNGDALLAVEYDGQNLDDYAADIVVDESGYICVTGASETESTYFDILTIKYNQDVTAVFEELISFIPNKIQLFNNCPNPFNSSTNIGFEITSQCMVIVEIFDLLGRKIEVLADRIFDQGYNEVCWDATKYSSGLYFYVLRVGDYTETKKMLLLK